MTSIACIGDSTTHGGRIITGSDTMDIDGRKGARVGDLVSCPEHGVNPIIQGSDMLTDTNGKHVALDGHLTACGSRIIALGDHGSID
ncbi:PAAR domain-containing protein [Caballeronia sp. GAWG1-1]|uniref:PAAR domain-containing protein n=1 Tax=Caballeronia sp. GAWG1-1 TaxID=2921742 RepID=UPI002028D808|nr:PAAR domain-containing protein [Caballeronia sp. GAWG1-1]